MKICLECCTQYDDSIVKCTKCGYTKFKEIPSDVNVKNTDTSLNNSSSTFDFIEIFSFITTMLILLTVTTTVMGFVNISKAFDIKKNAFSYKYSYVGGDAYNAIINSNHFVGYIVLGMGCLIISVLLVFMIIKLNQKQK